MLKQHYVGWWNKRFYWTRLYAEIFSAWCCGEGALRRRNHVRILNGAEPAGNDAVNKADYAHSARVI